MDINDNEMSYIITTWKIPMQDPEESGKLILTRFFEKYPHNLKYFDAFQGKTIPEIAVDPKFKTHAGKVVKLFDNLISSVSDKGRDTALKKEVWLRLSASHARKQIKKQSFLELKSIMKDVICEVCQLNELQINAWDKLLNYVFGLMCDKLAINE